MAFWRAVFFIWGACTFLGTGTAWAQVPACPDPAVQERQAYEYLNHFRGDPPGEGRKLGLNLKNTAPARPLHWNAQLARIAHEKAESMASRGYFSHETPEGLGSNQQVALGGYHLPTEYLEAGANTVESLAAGAETGIEALSELLVDAGIADAYHRVHLLAATSPFDEHTEVGIGVVCVPASEYGYYYVVLTAPKPEPSRLPTVLSGTAGPREIVR